MKTVLITGGSGGIGRGLVRAFGRAGYQVAFTYCHGKEAAEALQAQTGALALFADSENEDSVISAVKTAVDNFGHIDCLVNNAGISVFSLLTDMSVSEWNRLMSVNVTGAFLFSREVLKQSMLPRHEGSIIQISSMWGLTGACMEVAYSTTKAALIGMTKALAKEVGPSGITVNAVAPGVIDTPMNAHLGKDVMDELKEETPVGRIGTPADVAAAVLFLAGEGGRFVTGEVINVSGGFVI